MDEEEQKIIEPEGYDPDSPYDWDTGMLKSELPKKETLPLWKPEDIQKKVQEKSKRNAFSVGMMIGFVLLIILCCGVIGKGIYGFNQNKSTLTISLPQRSSQSAEQKENVPEAGMAALDNGAVFDEIDWEDTSWKADHVNYPAEDLGSKYYEEIVDCIDSNVDYTISREFYDYYDQEKKVCIRIDYLQLEGPIPNLESINEELKETSLYLAHVYEEDESGYNAYIDNFGGGFLAETDSYVTYNSDETISIVLQESCQILGRSYENLYGVNINLKTGTVLDNTSILEVDEQFIQDFKKLCMEQNETLGDGMEQYSDQELASFFTEDGYLILFYTPLGMEIGHSFDYNGSTGYVTITCPDYQKYTSSL